jgi:hypothetical protein
MSATKSRMVFTSNGPGVSDASSATLQSFPAMVKKIAETRLRDYGTGLGIHGA